MSCGLATAAGLLPALLEEEVGEVGVPGVQLAGHQLGEGAHGLALGLGEGGGSGEGQREEGKGGSLTWRSVCLSAVVLLSAALCVSSTDSRELLAARTRE